LNRRRTSTRFPARSKKKKGRPKQGATMMNHDDHAMLIEVKAQLEELRTQQAKAQNESAWDAVQRLQTESSTWRRCA
jgi:hypothetical protein